MNLILANNPETKTVGLLYDMGQDSSKTPIEEAKKFLDKRALSTLNAQEQLSLRFSRQLRLL